MDQYLWEQFTNKQYLEVLSEAGCRLRDTDALSTIHVAGLSLLGLGKIAEGMDWVCASLALTDASAAWFTNGATACMEKDQYIHALLFLKNGLETHPDDLKMTYMTGLCQVNIHEWTMAIESFNKALVIDPGFYHAKLGIGFCHHMLAEYETAMAVYSGIRSGTSDDMEIVHNNYACVLMEMNRQEDALQYLIDNCPGSERAGTLYNMSFLYLGLGVWPLGWQLYKYRDTVGITQTYTGEAEVTVPKVDHPLARTLHDIHGKHLLLFHEQGFGDTIQFIRYAQMLEPIASKITIGVPKALVRLTQTLVMQHPFDVICDNAGAVACDVALPMLDAPELFETTPSTIPNPGPYFRIPDEEYKYKLPPSQNLRVGLCWAGATRLDNIRAHSIDKRRSIPFEYIEPLLNVEGCDFFSLQLSDHHKDHPKLTRVLNDGFDMLDTASIATQLDLVITIDSSVAHLAASFGIWTWMLSRFDGCWRWGWNGETTTPWYSTMRIFRQPEHNSWPVVVATVISELQGLVKATKI